MLKLMKYLKKYFLWILLSIVLIFVQAQMELTLPDYMSNIVDVGISKSGIESSVPKVIRAKEMDKIFYVSTEEEIQFIKDNYTLISKKNLSEDDYANYLKKYSVLDTEDVYEKNKEITDTTRLEEIFDRSLTIVASLQYMVQMGETQKGNTEKVEVSLEMMQGMLAQMPQDGGEMTEVSELQRSSITSTYLKGEYDVINKKIAKDMSSDYIYKTGGVMVLIALAGFAAAVIAGLCFSKIAAGVAQRLRTSVFRKVESFSNTEFDKFSTASLITRSTNDIQQVQMMVVMFRMLFFAPIIGVGAAIKVFDANKSMVWIIALAVIAVMTLVAVIFALAIPKFNRIQKLIDKVNLVTRESLSGMMVIRAFNTEKHEEKRFDDVNKDLTKVNLFVGRLMSVLMPAMMFVMSAVSIMIVWFGGKQVDAGSLEVGKMMAFIQYAMHIIMSFLFIAMLFIMMPRAYVSLKRIFEVLDTEVIISDPKESKAFEPDKKGIIEFKKVTFSYPEAEEPVLKDITFTAKAGQTTAFIGSTGSGKSTLINLIPRFYDVTSGEILVDGVDVRDVTQHSLRDKIGYIPQKGLLFAGTIESNLKYADENATMEDIKHASDIAQASEFIETKTEGYESAIAQGGTNVSGGQKQRLSIARALVKKPEIYIFDDSFSALDFKTDATLRAALKKETGDSTVLIVAQRISTIMNAEQIIVLDEGEVVGIGTHKELLNTCEVYKEIAYSQLSKEELA